MIKKHSLRLILPLLVVLTVVSACGKRVKNIQLCESDCLTFENETLFIEANAKDLIVENVYQLKFQAKEKILSAKLVSVSMNMGDIPLFLVSTKNQYEYTTDVIFGMCAEPKMEWQLLVVTENNNFRFPITTRWPDQNIGL